MNRATLSAQLKQQAYGLGFDLAGIVPAGPAAQAAAYRRWLDKGYHGSMHYLARSDAVAQRVDTRTRLDGARSLIVLGVSYSAALSDPARDDPSRGRIASYAWGLDYHDVLKPALYALDAWLAERSGRTTRGRVSVDSAPVLERDWAQAAGLGFAGKNTCLIHPHMGSWLFLATLLVPEELAYDTAPALATGVPPGGPLLFLEADHPAPEPPRGPSWRFADGSTGGCGGCTRCLAACPTAAFVDAYTLDARRCISYLTIELKGSIPPALRPAMGNWIFGCDICQAVCPWNLRRERAPSARGQTLFAPYLEQVAPPLIDLLALDEATFRARYRHSPLRRAGRRGLLRNACVAAGNWGDARVVPALVRCLNDPEPLIRGHAAWALGRIHGAATYAALAARQAVENEPAVLAEIEAALAG